MSTRLPRTAVASALFTLIVLAGVTAALAMPPDYQWTTAPSNSSVYTGSFVTSTDGWVVGDAGAFHTTDGGSTWTTGDAGVGLSGVTFLDSQHGWISGQTGRIRRTNDGGSTWATQTAPFNVALGPIRAIDATHAWIPAVGGGGTVFYTDDAGATWHTGSMATAESIQRVSFADPLNGWAVGYNGVIAHSTDGGHSWSLQSAETSAALKSVFAVDSQSAWIGEYGRLFHTTNGGASWTLVPLPKIAMIYDIEFRSSTEGWAVGNQAVFHTRDGGATWTLETDAGGHDPLGVAFVLGDARTTYFPGYQCVLKFTLPSYSIVATQPEHATITPSATQTVDRWSDADTLTVTPETGYRVQALVVDGASAPAAATYRFTDVTQAHTLSALIVRTHTIIPSAGAHGSISPPTAQTVDLGSDSPTFTVTPDPGYHVADVMIDGHSVGAVTSYRFEDVAADHTIAAFFAADKVAVSITRTPSSASKTYKRKKGSVTFALGATMVGPAYNTARQSITLESSKNRKSWKSLVHLTTDSAGHVSRSIKAKKKGTTYYRWSASNTTRHSAAHSSKFKAVIK